MGMPTSRPTGLGVPPRSTTIVDACKPLAPAAEGDNSNKRIQDTCCILLVGVFLSHVINEGVVCEVGIWMPACVLHIQHVGIVFNQSAGAVTDISQSANDINPYLSSSSVQYPGHRKPVLILPNGLRKPGVHDIITFL